jgi:hypothetical protein
VQPAHNFTKAAEACACCRNQHEMVGLQHATLAQRCAHNGQHAAQLWRQLQMQRGTPVMLAQHAVDSASAACSAAMSSALHCSSAVVCCTAVALRWLCP